MEATKRFAILNEGYSSKVAEASSLCFLSCASTLQMKCINDLDEFIEETCTSAKKVFVDENNIDLTERVIVFQAQLSAFRHELQCLVYLKKDDAENAWDHLIAAENAVKIVGKLYGKAEDQFLRFRKLEQIFFPKQTFMSAGFIIKKATCSICSSDYELCEHIQGRIYRGDLCCRTIEEADLREVSILTTEEPYDRRCRVTHISQDGIKTNLLTRQTETCEMTEHATISGYSIRYD